MNPVSKTAVMTDNLPLHCLVDVRARWVRIPAARVALVTCAAHIVKLVEEFYAVNYFEASRQVRNWLREKGVLK